MDSKKLASLLLILTILILTTTPILASCGFCPPSSKPNPYPPKSNPPKYNYPPKTSPPKTGPIVLPPVIGNPPIIGKPPIIGNPPVIGNPPGTGNCPPGTGPTVPVGPTPTVPVGPGPATCPIDTLKLGACVDLLGGLIHIGLGDPVVNQCCPLLQGLVNLEAAVCLCTAIRLKLLGINLYLPIALQLLLTCGLTPPPGFTCPPL